MGEHGVPPYLFLDIDGVLNDNRRELNPRNVGRLKAILARVPDLRIVISSAWRVCYSLDYIHGALRAAGFRGELWGVTPRLGGKRGHEIEAYCCAHEVPLDRIAVLDDDDDWGPLESRWVLVSNSDRLPDGRWGDPRRGDDAGLQDAHVEAVVRLLTEVTDGRKVDF